MKRRANFATLSSKSMVSAMVFRSALAPGQTPQQEREASPKTHVQTSQASRGTLAASGRTDRRVRSAISRHGPIATNPHARRRSSTLPRQRRGPPCVAEASGAHRAGALHGRPEPSLTNKNRLVAPRVASGRLSRRRCPRTWGYTAGEAHARPSQRSCSHRE